MFRESSTVPWAVLQQAIRHYVKAQIVQARSLHYHEICHVQCMILLPRYVYYDTANGMECWSSRNIEVFSVLRCKTNEELESLELELYGDLKCMEAKERHVQLRDRLLTELVLPATPIERREFMMVRDKDVYFVRFNDSMTSN